MVISCSAYGCSNKWSRDSPIHFHKFPFRSEKLCQKWVSALKRKNFTPTKASLVCSDHFREEDYIRRIGMTKKRLKSNAVPSIFNFPVFDQFPAHFMQQSAILTRSSKKTGKLKTKKKRTPKKCGPKCYTKSNDSAVIESLTNEIEFCEDVDRKAASISEFNMKNADKIGDVEEELMNVDEEDKCDILGSIWGERLKLLPLDIRVIARKIINKVFERAISGTLMRKGP